MDKDRIAGAVKVAVGDLKVAVGSLDGDRKTVLKGRVGRTVGKVQNVFGRLKDAVRDVVGAK